MKKDLRVVHKSMPFGLFMSGTFSVYFVTSKFMWYLCDIITFVIILHYGIIFMTEVVIVIC